MDSTQHRRVQFEAVAHEVFEPLQRYIRRRIGADQADDVLSDTMLVVWRRIDDVPVDRALPWCYGIARRIIANVKRGETRRLRLVERLESEPMRRIVPDPADDGADPEMAAAIDRLSPGDREVIRLWAWEQLEPREIALVIDSTVNAATLRLSRARARLGRQLSRQNSAASGHEPLKGTQERP